MRLAKAPQFFILVVAMLAMVFGASPAKASPVQGAGRGAKTQTVKTRPKHATPSKRKAKPKLGKRSKAHARARHVARKPHHVAAPSIRYTNWAGYSAQAGDATAVNAEWKVPAVTWAGRDGYSNIWVGLGDGVGSHELIQAGTEHDNICVQASHGKCLRSRSTYSFWFETYPDATQQIVTNLKVKPGDHVSANVAWDAKQRAAHFTLCNLTANACVVATKPSAAPNGVVQWIVERPSTVAGRLMALAKFTPVTMTNNWVRRRTGYVAAQSLRPTNLQMYCANHALATTAPIAHNRIAVTYRNSA